MADNERRNKETIKPKSNPAGRNTETLNRKRLRPKKHVADDPAVQPRRIAAGKWLKEKRNEAGLTLRAMANESFWFTFISQIENGRRELPMELWKTWAEVLKVDPRIFAARLLAFYQPDVYQMMTEVQ